MLDARLSILQYSFGLVHFYRQRSYFSIIQLLFSIGLLESYSSFVILIPSLRFLTCIQVPRSYPFVSLNFYLVSLIIWFSCSTLCKSLSLLSSAIVLFICFCNPSINSFNDFCTLRIPVLTSYNQMSCSCFQRTYRVSINDYRVEVGHGCVPPITLCECY